jgi:deferrochelatase/peroxidase EfeB
MIQPGNGWHEEEEKCLEGIEQEKIGGRQKKTDTLLEEEEDEEEKKEQGRLTIHLEVD